MQDFVGYRHSALLLLYVILSACLGNSQSAPPPIPLVVFILADGSQLTGSVLSQGPDQVIINTKSFRASGGPPVTVVLDATNIASCSMIDPGVDPITISSHLCAAAVAPIHS